MKDDNTPTISARHRKKTPNMRLRTEMAKSLQKLGTQTKVKRGESKEQVSVNEGSGKVLDPNNLKKADLNLAQIPRSKKNVLAEPAKPSSKFRKRQLHKSWLPTHLYHSKRAHMTLPAEPLWRFAIPLTPTNKSYRATHRAMASRGCVAWDTSYMSTIGLEGVEASLVGLLRGIGVEETYLIGKTASKWRRGTRGWKGWVNERDGEQRAMATADIFWSLAHEDQAMTVENIKSQKKKEKRKLFLRVHPSAFLQVWTEILKCAKMQRPSVTLEDLRFELGSIDCTGPGSTETLIGVLNPIAATTNTSSQVVAPEKIWPTLGAVTNPGSLPANAFLGFEISDPRLRHPPRTIPKPEALETNPALLQILSDWPPDKTGNALSIFDRKTCYLASKSLPSQKSINRRKGDALPGVYPDPLPQDPRIPIFLMASRSPATGNQGSWTVVLPWKCVLPVWYSLMHYPLSSGTNPRFGGLQEKRQMAFEHGVPWFPGDFPGTKAGWEWELQEREKRKADWEKRPRGKKIEWSSVDLGNGERGEIGIGWACDWERLFQGPSPPKPVQSNDNSTITPIAPAIFEPPQPSSPKELHTPPLKIHHTPSPMTVPHLPTSTALTTISLSLLSRGAPTACARIYRLPTSNIALRERWLSLTNVPRNHTSRRKSAPPPTLPKDTPSHIRARHLAASLLAGPPEMTREQQQKKQEQEQEQEQEQQIPSRQLQAGDPDYPPAPLEEDLIGFVTTGNFNLGEGRSSAIGCVALARVVGTETDREVEVEAKAEAKAEAKVEAKAEARAEAKAETEAKTEVEVEAGAEASKDGKAGDGKGKGHKRARDRNLCVVREAGQRIARLARWEFV